MGLDVALNHWEIIDKDSHVKWLTFGSVNFIHRFMSHFKCKGNNMTCNNTSIETHPGRNVSSLVNYDDGIPSSMLITLSVLLCTLIIASLIVNSTCFALFVKNRALLVNPSYKFLFNYILTSFARCLTLMPVTLTCLIAKRWVFGEMLCHFTGILSVCLSIAGLLALASMAFDRYHFIVNPLTYPIKMTSFKVNVVLFFIWFVSIISSLMPLFGWGQYEYSRSHMLCTVNWPNASNFGLYFAIVGYLLPLVLQAYCYGCIIKVAKRHANFGRRFSRVAIIPLQVARIIRETSATKTIKKTLIVMGIFTVTWTPYMMLIVALTFVTTAQLSNVSRYYLGASLLAFVPTLLYPLLFVFRARGLKKEVRLLLSQSSLFTCVNQVEPVDFDLPADTERRKSLFSIDSYDFISRRRSSRTSRVSWAVPAVIEDGIEPSKEPRMSLTGSTITTDIGNSPTGSLLPGELDYCNNSASQPRRKSTVIRI
eukprot:gene16892-18598_t